MYLQVLVQPMAMHRYLGVHASRQPLSRPEGLVSGGTKPLTQGARLLNSISIFIPGLHDSLLRTFGEIIHTVVDAERVERMEDISLHPHHHVQAA